MQNKKYLEELLDEICCVVTASPGEFAYLVQTYSEYEWDSSSHVQVIELGQDHGRPVSAKLMAKFVEGRKVLVVEPMGPLFNAELLNSWLDALCAPKWGQPALARGTALEFYTCKSAIQKALYHKSSRQYKALERDDSDLF